MRQKVRLLFRSFSFKIMLSYWLIGLLPLLLISSFIFHYLTVFIQTNSIEALQETHNRVDEIVSSNITAVTTTLDSVQNYNLYGRIDSLLASLTTPDSANRLSVLMNILLQSSESVENVIAVNGEGEWMHASRYQKYRSGYYDFENAGIIDRSPMTDAVILPRHHSQDYFSNADTYVVSVVKNFTDNDGNYVGSIIMDVNLSYFQNMLPNDGNSGYFALTDYENYCIFSNNIWNVDNYIPVEDMASYPVTFDFESKLPNESSFFIESDINGTWKALTYIDKNALTQEIDVMRNTFFLVIVLITIVLLLLSFWYTHQLTAPVNRIIAQMKGIQNGNLDVSLQDEKVPEFSQIVSGLNEMIEKLKIHIDQTYHAHIKQKEAELNVLKMQINPHVLYNMLEIINMTAIEQDDYKVSSMVVSLGSQFKYMLSNDRDFVSLREEIEIVNHYFLFVQIRYDDRIRLTINVEEPLKDLLVTKFILQPLVENSVKHGYDNCAVPPPNMDININIMLFGEEYLIIDVFDNGKGMEKDQLEMLQKHISDAQGDSPMNSIGLKNVCERLRFFYGARFSAEINSFPGLGTKIHLKIPLKEAAEDADDQD